MPQAKKRDPEGAPQLGCCPEAAPYGKSGKPSKKRKQARYDEGVCTEVTGQIAGFTHSKVDSFARANWRVGSLSEPWRLSHKEPKAHREQKARDPKDNEHNLPRLKVADQRQHDPGRLSERLKDQTADDQRRAPSEVRRCHVNGCSARQLSGGKDISKCRQCRG
ncbi:hypothetical protein [Bradyrhizobium sp. NAS80.1]|uniref:hypothetical protein n=1 Tax=Bradyrhizobium sp. NAS80.1 TaxID=1680159 RepID=UPI001FDA3A8A|nr:hypothetical protein [Bradyrhizobium sp. NAS80.1]